MSPEDGQIVVAADNRRARWGSGAAGHDFLRRLVPGPINVGPCWTLAREPPQQGHGHHSQNFAPANRVISTR